MNLRQKLEEEMKRHEKEMKRCEEQMMKLFFTKPVREKLMQTDEDKLKILADIFVNNYDELIRLVNKRIERAASAVPEPQTETQAPGGMAGGAAYGELLRDEDGKPLKLHQAPYSGCKGFQLKGDTYVRNNFDKVAEKYITLDQGEKAPDKATQNERRIRQHNEKLAEGEQTKYIWKDDLKGRVKSAMSEASDKEDFLKKLTERGVEGTFHETKKGRKYYTYELTDPSSFGEGKVPQNLRARSYKMGADYDYETIDKMLPDKPDPAPETPAIQSDPVPHTGLPAAPVVEIATTFGKRKSKPSSASQGIQKAAPAPGGGKPRFGKRNHEKAVQDIQKIIPDIQKDSPAKVQVPPPPDPRQEAERQRKEKERMEAENRRRREVLRRQAEKDATSARLARAFEDMDQREKENEDTWDLYY